MGYEIKRFFYGRDVLYFAFGSLFFPLLTAVNVYIVQPHFSGNYSITIDYYNAVTQCMPFVFAPVAGVFFSKDLEKNVTLFYRSYSIPFVKYILRRLGTCFVGGALFIFVESMGLLFFAERSFIKALQISFFLLLDFLYFLLMCCLLGIISKRRTITVFAVIGSTFIFSILNIMPIPKLQGHLFILDGNSVLTNKIMNFVESGAGNFISIASYQLVEIAILACLLLFFIYRESNNRTSKQV